MLVSKYLEKAKNLIAVPSAWCQNSYGATEDGTKIASWRINDEECVKRCISGALLAIKESEGVLDETYDYAWEILASQCPKNIINFNDDENTSHDDIIKVFNKAIALAREEERNG